MCKEFKNLSKLFKQTKSMIEIRNGHQYTIQYFRMVCFACSKYEWKTKDGIILQKGVKNTI